MQKPSIPKGTRDFSPAEMMRRNYIFDSIRQVFRTFGFAPLETPAMENLSTLLGKYGDEGDKLLFKILNSGDYAAGLAPDELRQASKICEKGLRYDLTVPFARYVVQHQGEIVLPFKRYQIQPVWRADRPQKGRYREFYQCDVDVVGSRSLLNEVELVEIVERVFRKLGIAVTLRMNNRKILYGIAETIGHADKMIDITVAIDKLEKIGIDNVKAELREHGIDDAAIDRLQPILELRGDNRRKLSALRDVLSGSETGLKGVEELETVFGYVERLGIALAVELDLSLARGLNYYTGAIFEVKANDYAIGSICGGGRYDGLMEILGGKPAPCVGFAMGAERVLELMKEFGVKPETPDCSVYVIHAGEGTLDPAVTVAESLRDFDVSTIVHGGEASMKSQMKKADASGAEFAVIIGDTEAANGTVSVKRLRDRGEDARFAHQETLPADDACDTIFSELLALETKDL